MKFWIKAVLYYTASLVVSLLLCGGTTFAIYWFLNTAGLQGFGDMLLFKISLAALETSTCVYLVSELSETILFKGDRELIEEPE